MIDTVRVKVRIPNDLKTLILKDCSSKVYYDKMGELRQIKSGKLPIPPYNHSLSLTFDTFRDNLIYLEGSYPKIWYGDNVHLLYENQLEAVLKVLRRALIHRYGDFPDYTSWEFQRIDTSYSWKLESEEKAIEVIQYVEDLQLPRNPKHFYGNHETVTFGSKKSKTITFYRKSEDYKKKDFKKLIMNGFANLAFDSRTLSEGVVRFEILNRVDHLQQYFDTKTPITFERFLEKDVILNLLHLNFKRLQGNINLKSLHDRAIYKSLLEKYRADKATRLFCFYKTYYSTLSTKNLIHKYDSSSDISNSIKDLKEVSLAIPTHLASSVFDFSIPSPIAVNLPPSSAALAEELDRRLKLIDEKVNFVEGKIVEKNLPF